MGPAGGPGLVASRNDASESTEPAKSRFWPFFLVALLAANFVGVGVLVWVANSDRSFFVEPDYHRKALRWNERMARQRQSRQLGWRVDVSLRRMSGDQARVEARISDGRGAPVEGAAVHIETFHKARAARVLQADLVEAREPGAYAALLRMWRPGLWEVRVTAQRGTQRFEQQLDRDL